MQLLKLLICQKFCCIHYNLLLNLQIIPFEIIIVEFCLCHINALEVHL